MYVHYMFKAWKVLNDYCYRRQTFVDIFLTIREVKYRSVLTPECAFIDITTFLG